MGLIDVDENGVDLGGGKNRYKRIDLDYGDEEMTHQRRELRQQHEIKKGTRNTQKYVLACAIFASLNSVLLGYDVGVMSGAILFIQEDLNISEVQQEVLVGILSIISLLGSLAGGKTSDAIGRKWTMAFAAIVFQTGAVIMSFAPSFSVLMIGRLLAGIGIGFGVMIAPVYIAEISPSVDRGSLTSFPEIFINLGILLGYVSNYVFSGLPVHINWRVMLGVGVLPSVFIGFALFVIPESPRWLVMKNRVEEARLVLTKTIESETEVEERLVDIQKAAASGMCNDKYEESRRGVWRELLNPTSPGVKRMLIAGCGIQICQQITGIDALVYYSPTIFKDAGIRGNNQLLAATMAVGFTKTAFIMIAIFLIDRVGRKPLLYVSTIGMTSCLFGLSLSLSVFGGQGGNNLGIGLVVLCVCGNVAFFSIGIGPVCWVLSSEIFPLKLRAQASGLGAVGSRVSSGLVAMSFLSVSRAITVGGTFLVFAVTSALSVGFIHSCVPETKGKSLEEIEMMFRDEEDDERRVGQGGEVELGGDAEHLVSEAASTL